MDDTKEEKTSSGRRPLSLRRTVDTGTVRQSFSHGRTKAVVVEKKRRRVVPPKDAAPEKPAAAPEAEKPAPKPQAAPKPSQQKKRGAVLRTLSEEERQARAQALSVAKAQEAERRKRDEVEAKERAKRAEEEARRLEEARQEEERRQKEAEERRTAEEAARKKLEEEEAARKQKAAKPKTAEKKAGGQKSSFAAEEGNPLKALGGRLKVKRERVDDSRATTKPKAEPRRRTGKLTISNALDDEERQRSLASVRRAREREKQRQRQRSEPQKVVREVVIPETITVADLAQRMSMRAVDLIKELMKQGQMVTANEVLDADTAQLIAEDLGHNVTRVSESDVEEGLAGETDEDVALQARPPVVTIMGHVDHGKTSLLDAIRQTDVVSGEAGGITQHIGAYQVTTPDGHPVTFLDTPGHAAFTQMRSRGAQVTDIVIIVVAADDSVMPQTEEAISHAKAAGVPIIVAINKIDKPDADPTRVRNDLLRYELVTESMGGDVQDVEVSAMKKTNLDGLLEQIALQAELLELKANPERAADGAVIESRLDKGRGPVATLLVQRGTLRRGDVFVAGAEWGKVRALIDDKGRQINEAGPSLPVEVLGLNAAPEPGEPFVVVESEARAREVAEFRQRKKREKATASTRTSLDQMMSQLRDAEVNELPLLIKGDVQGSVEAIAGSLDKLSTDEVKAKMIHSGVGGITESDVILAEASKAVVVGFNVRANKAARDEAHDARARQPAIRSQLQRRRRRSLLRVQRPERPAARRPVTLGDHRGRQHRNRRQLRHHAPMAHLRRLQHLQRR